MALPFVADLGSVQQASGTGPANLNLTTGVAVGDEIIVYVLLSSPITQSSGITDNATGGSNTYTRMASSVGATNKDVEIWRCQVANALISGNTIAVAYAGSLAAIVGAAVFRGVVNATDKTHGSSGTSTTPTDALAASSYRASLSLAALGLTSTFGAEVTTSTPDAEYTQLHYVQHTLTAMAFYTYYRVVKPSATATFDPVISSSVSWRVVQASMGWSTDPTFRNRLPMVGAQ